MPQQRLAKTLTILGINSGTSADGLDFALVRIRQSKSSIPKLTTLAQGETKYPASLRRDLLEMADSFEVTLEKVALLDEALGEFIGRRAESFLSRVLDANTVVDAVASHGQTIRHHPAKKKIAGFSVSATMQIGSPERISAKTALPVISHFRQAHTALGGEGAPITTTAVHLAASDKFENRIILNIGGIANLFYLPANGEVSETRALDIGPGNVLLDQAARELFAKKFDRSGACAAQGVVSKRLLSILLSKRFFEVANNQRTISTGREKYGPLIIEKILDQARSLELSKNDTMATLSQLSASLIFQKINSLKKKLRVNLSVCVSGGGAKNTDLIRRIREGLENTSCHSLRTIGYDPDCFEALSYALLGYLRLQGMPSAPLKSAATAKQKSRTKLQPILGRVCLPPIVSGGKNSRLKN